MSPILRILLIAVSALMLVFSLRKIRRSQLRIEDSLFWLVLSLATVILSIFPQLADWLSRALGILSPTNLVFLVFIFILLVKSFFQSLQQSRLESRLTALVQANALLEKRVRELEEKEETLVH